MLDDEIHYQILKAIEDNPSISQRELASHLGVSLGKANYCLKELIKKGIIKAGGFSSNPNKRVYAYLLTPRGIKEKSKVTLRFLKKKMDEYESIREEIVSLKEELEQAQTEKDNLQCLRS
ncbi:MAG: MarR family EPS-associated transcriptional regulator [Pseudomonadota bacterium]